jgi:hypothetical protein
MDDLTFCGPDLGVIAATGTTCEMYVTGEPFAFNEYYEYGVVQYSFNNKGKVHMNPGVFFYYTGRSMAFQEGGTVVIEQENNGPDIGPFRVLNQDVKLWLVNSGTSSCAQVQLASGFTQNDDGDVTIDSIPEAPDGSYWVISVKYQSKSVTGLEVGDAFSVDFTFTTTFEETGDTQTDLDGITLAFKEN